MYRYLPTNLHPTVGKFQLSEQKGYGTVVARIWIYFKMVLIDNTNFTLSLSLSFIYESSIVPVLWIRIRSDPKLFAGSGAGSVIINFGSGSYELQFLVTKIA